MRKWSCRAHPFAPCTNVPFLSANQCYRIMQPAVLSPRARSAQACYSHAEKISFLRCFRIKPSVAAFRRRVQSTRSMLWHASCIKREPCGKEPHTQRRKAIRAKRQEDVLRHLFHFGNHNGLSLGSLIRVRASSKECRAPPSAPVRVEGGRGLSAYYRCLGGLFPSQRLCEERERRYDDQDQRIVQARAGACFLLST